MDEFIFRRGTVVNVGIAGPQGHHRGGGLQFEDVSGPEPVFLEHVHSPERVLF